MFHCRIKSVGFVIGWDELDFNANGLYRLWRGATGNHSISILNQTCPGKCLTSRLVENKLSSGVFCLQAAWGTYASTDAICRWTVSHEMGFPRSACRASSPGVHLTPAKGTSAAPPSSVLTYGECMNAGMAAVTAASSRFTRTCDMSMKTELWRTRPTHQHLRVKFAVF